jgi:phthalate 4,5-dioxygenase oxygenase subunit
MLSTEDNRLLTETGDATPMGALLRKFWVPALVAEDLPAAGGLPLRVRIMGENLLFYRSPNGDVGLMGEKCPHRGASLFYGRNEDCGLRCVYHGWKFNAAGDCIDLPNDPRGDMMKTRIKHKAYPCVVRGGLVWTYMGEGEPPAFPDFEWLSLPESQVHLSARIQRCNWLQAMEGEIDSSHGPFLHGRVDDVPGEISARLFNREIVPTFEVAPSDGGLQIGAKRDLGDGTSYWRINQFLLPFWTVVPPAGDEPDFNGHAWVPIDDEHTLCIMYSYKLDAPYSDRRLKLYQEGARGRESGHMSRSGREPFDATRPYGMYWSKFNASNNYELNVEAQTTKYFSGMGGLWVQDAGLQESMGAISDRTDEHLCSSDIGIVQVRRLLKRKAQECRDGTFAGPASGQAYRMRSVGIVLSNDVQWMTATAPYSDATLPLDYEIA